MNDTKRTYLKCSAKWKDFGNGSGVLNVGIKVSDLAEFVKAHKTESGYLNLVITERREQGQYGDTHAIYLDTYTPKRRDEEPPF